MRILNSNLNIKQNNTIDFFIVARHETRVSPDVKQNKV